MEAYGSLIVSLGVVFVAIIILVKTAVVVPQQNAFVVERLGKYAKTLNAGFHILIPFIEKVAYKHTLKEQAADIAIRTVSEFLQENGKPELVRFVLFDEAAYEAFAQALNDAVEASPRNRRVDYSSPSRSLARTL